MHPLKSAVLHHKIDEISRVTSEYSCDGLDALELRALVNIAVEMGNVCTIARLARLFPEHAAIVNYRGLLSTWLSLCASNYFGRCEPEKAARRLWAQVNEGRVDSFSRDEPDFVLDSGSVEDMRFVLEQAGVRSKNELQAFAANRRVGPNISLKRTNQSLRD
jgi:hypothetical protein